MSQERVKPTEHDHGRDGHDAHLPLEEQHVLREITDAIKTIGYGSIVLTIHDGRLVEFTKTMRSRIPSKQHRSA